MHIFALGNSATINKVFKREFMKLRIVSDKKFVRDEVNSWSTFHFTWGEGNQETFHCSTTRYYSTKVDVYTDAPNEYKRLGGLTGECTFKKESNYQPDSNSSIEELTGLQLLSTPYNNGFGLQYPVNGHRASLSEGLYIPVYSEQKEGLFVFTYKKVEISNAETGTGMTLVRTVTIETYEEEEKFFK